MKKIISVLLLTALVLQISGVPASSASAENKVSAPQTLGTEDTLTYTESGSAEGGMALVKENGSLALYADTENGSVALLDKDTGEIYRSNPVIAEDDERISGGQARLMSAQLEILYYDASSIEQERNSQVAVVAKGGLSYSETEKGINFRYVFTEDDIEITLCYELCDEYLSVSAPVDMVKETGENRLTEISVLPYFGCGSFDDEGYILFPDGCGTVIEMNNGRSAGAAVKERVYGDDVVVNAERDTETNQNMTFPVIGIKRGQSAFTAVVSEGDAGAYINAYTSGMKKNYNCAYFSFEYRQTDTVILDSSSKFAKTVKMISDIPISSESMTVRFYPLEKGAGYNEMAQCFREYLMSEKGLKESEASDSVPFFVDCYGALRKQGTVFFIPMQVTVPLTTYAQAGEIMKALSDAGIENIIFSYDGWVKHGISGKLPVSGSYEGKLGGKKEFLELISTAEEYGVTFLPNVNTVELVETGSGYTKNSSAAATLNGTPGLQYGYNLASRLRDTTLSPYYLVSPFEYEGIINKFYKKYDFDTAGISLSKNGYMLYSDYHKENCDRNQSVGYLNSLFEAVKDKGQLLLTKSANSYAAVASDYISEAPTTDSGYDITDYSVPFYQLVLSGTAKYSSKAVNLSSGAQTSLLKAIETGSGLCYAFTAQNFTETESTYLAYVYNSDYKDWTETAAEQYKVLNGVYEQTGGSRMVSHRRITDTVCETVFENGTVVRVNYGANDYTDDYGTVKASDYQVTGKSNGMKSRG